MSMNTNGYPSPGSNSGGGVYGGNYGNGGGYGGEYNSDSSYGYGTRYDSAAYQPPSQAAGFSETHTSTQVALTSAPHLMLLPSLVAGLVGVVLNAIVTLLGITVQSGGYLGLSVAGWALSGLAGVGFLGLFFTADNKERTRGIYQIIAWKQAMYWVTLALIAIGVVWSAVHLGVWVGKQ